MTTLLDFLALLGRATWEPVWIPILVWSLFALPFWGILERTDRFHPYAEYRLWQVLLGSLPFGIAATALLDGWLTTVPTMSRSEFSVVVLPHISTTAMGTSPAPSVQWIHAVGLVTLIAAVLGLVALGRLALDVVAAVRVRENTVDDTLPAPVRDTVNRLALSMSVARPVRTYITPDVHVPVTIGGRRPIVLLPPPLTDRPEALRMTLAHEFVHLRRYDDVAHLTERLITALFRVHPLVNRLATGIEEARECACDTAVLADEQTSTGAYARLLTSFADRSSPQRIGALSLSESPSSLTNRLHAMRSNVSRWLSTPVSLVASLLTIGFLVTFGIVACSDSVAPPSTNPSPTEPERSSATAQKKTSDEVFTVVEQQPDCGGVQTLADNLQYPELARKAGIEGRVFVQFIVDKSGSVIEPKVTKGVHEALNNAALAAVKDLECEPGTQRGEPVKVKMALPVTFRLPGDSASTSSEERTTSASKATGLNAIIHRYTRGKSRSQIVTLSRETRRNLHNGIYYPDLTRKAGIEDNVRIRFSVNGNGHATNLRVANNEYEDLGAAHEAHIAAAKQTIREVRFTPENPNAELDGKELGVQFQFQRPNSGP